ncbi:T9SS type A sorting domain-containing protein [bacterium]|nr:T9SS type A sorting domain-containing protein [bacterium]
MLHRTTTLALVALLFLAGLAVAEVSPDPAGGNADDLRSPFLKHIAEAWSAGEPLTPAQINLLRPFINFDMNQIDLQTGPDAFGYRAIDSDEEDGPGFTWYDITQTGEEIAAQYMLDDEDVVGPFEIGFDFPFYGENKTHFWVQSNGVISFFPTFVFSLNYPLPSWFYGPMIAWFWDDLDPDNGDDGGNIYYETREIGGHQVLIISFIEIDEYPDGPDQDNVTAQLLLRDDGKIRIQYLHVDEEMHTESCTVGIQNDDGTIGVQYLLNAMPADLLRDSLSVQFDLLEPTVFIHGIVRNAISAKPIPDATVQANGFSVISATDGSFSIGPFVEGQTIEVYTRADGFYSETVDVQIVAPTTTTAIGLYKFPQPMAQNYLSTMEVNRGRLTAEDDNLNWFYGIPENQPDQAHSGERAWGTRHDGNYLPLAQDWLVTLQSFRIISENARLSYWHWYSIEDYDGYNVQISTDAGDTWTLLEPIGGYPDTDGVWVNGWQPCFNNLGANNSVWEPVEFDLSDYQGQQVWFGFYFASDAFIQRPGVTIDDLQVYVEERGFPIELYAETTTSLIGENGGTLEYFYIIYNESLDPVTTDLWSQVRMPSGNDYGDPDQQLLTVEPGFTTIAEQTMNVPVNAPGGRYRLDAFTGEYPGMIDESAYFNFSKELDSQGDIPAPPPPPGAGPGEETHALSVHPNPFNEAASVRFTLPVDGRVSLRLYNVQGREVMRLNDDKWTAGSHAVSFNAGDLASGVYFIQLQQPGGQSTMQKVLLLK